jgi:hypothetical protein
MNERIKELSEQAVEEMDQEAFSEDMYIPNEYLEKFAELIVKECGQVLESYDPDFDWATVALKKHFGIE